MTPDTNTSKLPPLVSIDDVCQHFAITRPTLRAWIKRGALPAPTRPSGSVKGKAFWTADQIASAFDKKAA
jgi:predicted site-specific integrase-resolvase